MHWHQKRSPTWMGPNPPPTHKYKHSYKTIEDSLIILNCILQNNNDCPRTLQFGASLGAPWRRVRLPMQRQGFDPWPGKTPQATEQRGPGTISDEPALWSPEPHLRPCSRSLCPTARSPGAAAGGEPPSLQLEKSPGSTEGPAQPKWINILNHIKKTLSRL